jgi:selenocysteine-specific elongation factor
VYPAQVRPLDDNFARVRLAGTALPLAPGDRLVLRSSARRTTVAGATVLDIEPTRRAVDAPARLALPLGARILAAKPWIRADNVVTLAGTDLDGAVALLADLVAGGQAEVVAGYTVGAGALAELRAEAATITGAHHASHPIDQGIELAALAARLRLDSTQLRAALAGAAEIVVERDTVRLSTHGNALASDPAAQRFVDALARAPFAPPSPADLDVAPDVVRALVRAGTVVALDGIYFSPRALDDARSRIATAVVARGSLKLSDIRDLLGSTRKFVVPIIAKLDADGVTRRRGDDRIAGPNAPRYSSGG